LVPGTRLGPYEILGPLGAGGMGEVYRARDPRLSRDVAIKLLPEVLSRDPDRLTRFRREAQVLASFSHPHIGAIYGMEESSGLPALVLELVEGPTLLDRLASGPLPLEEALPIARQIAEALDAAHERGVIHRDLKPANIKIGPNDTVKLLDFGLARMADSGTGPAESGGASQSPTILQGMTGAGFIMGTASYMSPEQARGKPLDRRADIWAFGCVLYELLTGCQAFPGESVTDTLAAVLKSDPDWSRLPAGTPTPIRHLLRRCLQKDPQLRLRDIGDARLEIVESAGASQAAAHAEAAERQPQRSSLSKYAATAAVFALAGILAAWLALRTGASTRQTDKLKLVEVARLTHDIGFSGWPTWSPDGSVLAFTSNRSGNFEIYVRRVEGGQDVNITNDPADDFQPAFSPDGQSVAFVSTRSSRTGMGRIGSNFGLEFRTFGGDLWIVPSLGGQARRLAESANFPAWYPDGTRLAYVSGPEGHRSILEVATQAGQPKALLPSSASEWEIVRLQFSPGGAWMSFEAASDQVLIMPAVGGKPRDLIEASSYVWDSSGKRIFSIVRDPLGGSRLMSYDVDESSGNVRGGPHMLGVLTGLLREPAISRDGTRLAVGELEEALNLTLLPLTPDGSRPAGPEQVLSRGQVIDRSPFFSPDGKRIVMVSDRLGPKEAWIVDLDSGLQRQLQLPGKDLFVNFPTWSPDGKRIGITRYFPGDTQSIWLSASDGSHAEELVAPINALLGGPFSPDGKWLFYSADAAGIEQLFVVEIATRKSRQLTTSAGDKAVGAWSPDGRWVAYTSNATGNLELWRMPFPGGKEERLTAGDERMKHMSYSPDGRWIYIQPSHRNIYRLPASGGALQPVTTFPESGLFIEEPNLSPNGRSLAYCRSNGSSSLWLLTLGKTTPESK
jgi:Tol biopolymer transport system component